MRQEEEFSPLTIVKKNLTHFNRCAYRVYKSPKEFITVEAATALEAFRESGIPNPLRIVRETRFMERLVDQNKFTDREELVETGLVMEPPSIIMPHHEAVPQAERKPMDAFPNAVVNGETALSPEDIAALLNNAPAVEEAELSEDDITTLLEQEDK